MKASTPMLWASCALLGFLFLLAPSAARADVVWVPRCERAVERPVRPGETPECSDGTDNDGDGATDSADPDCSSPRDNQEEQEELFTCRDIILRVDFPQGFPLPEPESCPECYWTELIDFRPLLDAPLFQILEELPEIFEVSTPPTLAEQIPGLVDDPGILNLRLQYVGQDEIIGPAVIGEITLREPFGFPDGLTYVAQAFDTRAGRVVTNTGTLNATLRPGRDGLFDAKLSYSNWDPGAPIGALEGFDVELCPPWWPWPWPWPRRPRFDLRISSYKIDKVGFSRATPLELGLLLPLSSASRVTPYVGAGLGYYVINGSSAAAQDELGGYGALGIDIHLADRWGLSLEGAYREVGGSLGFDGPVFEAGIGFSF
jgi:hypothetical protein